MSENTSAKMILGANPFMSHPSVRIKGTENSYEPATCIDPLCPRSWPHMHCPFCVKTDVFQDPVILKAHYRVKHVDKGIEFAGLRILRCCEHCDIVGTIKGSKDFKGAHWHCYRCRNGFTRRDEAIKHYKTHFRNPSTTFQIQVAQDINQCSQMSMDETTMRSHISSVETVITTASIETDTVLSTEEVFQVSEAQEKTSGNEIQVSVAANETVGSEGQAIVIVPDIDGGEIVATLDTTPQELQAILKQKPMEGHIHATDVHSQVIHPSPVIRPLTVGNLHWKVELSLLEQQIRELKDKMSKLMEEKTLMEEQLNEEIENLKTQLHVSNSEIHNYQKREADLLHQLKIPLDDRVSTLLMELKQQHEELLHQQLAQLRQSYIQHHIQEVDYNQVDQSPSSTEAQLGSVIVDADKTETMAIVSGQPDGVTTHMIATMGDNNTVVLTPSDGYLTLPSSVGAGNIVLTSQALMTDSNTPLLVVPQEAAAQMKAGAVLNRENTGPLVAYHEDEQEVVVGSSDVELNRKVILLRQSSMDSDDISAEVDLSQKSTITMNIAAIDNETLQEAELNLQHKRRLEFEDLDNNHKVKKQKEL